MKQISTEVINRIQTLRKQGYSFRDIASRTTTSLGTTYFYSHTIVLSYTQKRKLLRNGYNKSLLKLDPSIRRAYSQKGGKNNTSVIYSREDLLNQLIYFYAKEQRTPTKKDFVKNYRSFLREFKTWNNAITEAKLIPNPVQFSHKHIAKDGHICDSVSEKIIDDWLTKNNIQHECHCKYPETKYYADFKVGNTYIEFFGLKGQLASYDKLYHSKMAKIKQKKYTVISLFPNDIFPKNKLKEKLKILL